MNITHALRFMRTAHGDQTDRSGAPYWQHPMRVMQRLGDNATLDEKLTALLHDIVEDTTVTIDQLRTSGFSDEIVEAVRLLTRNESMPYVDYIAALAASGNRMAIRVKLADLEDNLDPKRPRSDSLTERYEKASAMLQTALPS